MEKENLKVKVQHRLVYLIYIVALMWNKKRRCVEECSLLTAFAFLNVMRYVRVSL